MRNFDRAHFRWNKICCNDSNLPGKLMLKNVKLNHFLKLKPNQKKHGEHFHSSEYSNVIWKKVDKIS